MYYFHDIPPEEGGPLPEGIKRLMKKIKEMSEDNREIESHEVDSYEEMDTSDDYWGGEEEVATSRNDYKSRIDYYVEANKPMMAIFFSYFNMLSHNRINEDTKVVDGIELRGIINSDSTFIDYLPDYPPLTFTYTAMVGLPNGNVISAVFQAFRESNQIRNVIRLSSIDDDYLKSEMIYNMLFEKAVNSSNLKGSYLTIEDEHLHWKIRTLKELTFDDVFLPDDLMEDLETFTKLYDNKKVLQRYMFSGVPGTGKTESTRAISHILNQKGVTIIKTNICKIIKQKFDLAKILAPCVIILDDIDLYLGDRNSTSVSPLLGAFLDILDGVDKLPDDIGVIASTNAPHLIDLAAQRPGRFNKVLFFDELTSENIVNIIKKSLTSMNNKYDNVTENDIALLTNAKLVDFLKERKFTGAYIHEKVQEIKNNSEIHETEMNLDKIIAQITKKSETLKDKLRTRTIENELRGVDKKIGY